MFKQIKNNFYMTKFLFSFSKKYIITSFLIGLLSLYDSLVSIFLIRYIINSITNSETKFLNVVMVVFIACLLNVIITFINSWYNNKYLPNTTLRFRKHLNEKLYLRSLEMEISQFDNPEFYNDYTFVINDAENRVFSVYSSIQDFIINTAKLIIVLATIIFCFPTQSLLCSPLLL
jgi:ATP-binding cassette subfamily B protein